MASDTKDPSLNAAHQKLLRAMQEAPENRRCADCHGPAARWASTNLGCFLCIECSGIHRKLGVHITVVRSLTLDTWTPRQVERFRALGNAASAALYEAHLPPAAARPTPADARAMERFIRDKYERKLYAPAEHGGLAGVDTRARRAPAPHPVRTSAFARPTLGHRPSHRREYDVRQPAPAPAPAPRLRGSAGRRAEIMGTIMEMGFPPHAAARAVEAGHGDMQRAVEWVLQNEQVQDGFAPAAPARPKISPAQTAQASKPAAPPPQVDLLSFDDVPATKSAASSTFAAGTGFLVSNAKTSSVTASATSMTTATPASKNPPPWASDDDFADFGAFESALPEPASTAPPSVVQTSAPGTSGALANASKSAGGTGAVGGMSLSSLYARGSPAPAGALSASPASRGPAVAGALQAASVSQRTSVDARSRSTSPGKVNFTRGVVKCAVRPDAPKNISQVSMQSGQTGLSKANGGASPKNFQQKVSTLSPRSVPIKSPVPLPPPPGPTPSAFAETPPPPPTTTPPPLNDTDVASISGSAGPTSSDEHCLSKDTEVAPEVPTKSPEPEEPEDPFAGLAMFALSKSRKGKAAQKPASPVEEIGMSPSAPATASSGPDAAPGVPSEATFRSSETPALNSELASSSKAKTDSKSILLASTESGEATFSAAGPSLTAQSDAAPPPVTASTSQQPPVAPVASVTVAAATAASSAGGSGAMGLSLDELLGL